MNFLKRIALVLSIFTPLVLLSRLDIVAFGLFIVGIFLIFVPSSILLVLSVVLAVPVIRLFRHEKVLRAAFLVLVVSQSVILIFWLEGWTAASAFVKHTRGFSQSVIDPQLEHLFMMGFWLLAAFVFALIVEHLVYVFLNDREAAGRNFYPKRIGILLLEGLLLMGVYSSFGNQLRQARDVGVATSVSPDGKRSIQLVPMNAWIDVNGLVIVRDGRSLIWSKAGEIGDLLTEAEGGRFVWSADNSTAFLLLDLRGEKEVPMLGYNFRTNMEVNPSEYRKGNAARNR